VVVGSPPAYFGSLTAVTDTAMIVMGGADDQLPLQNQLMISL